MSHGYRGHLTGCLFSYSFLTVSFSCLPPSPILAQKTEGGGFSGRSCRFPSQNFSQHSELHSAFPYTIFFSLTALLHTLGQGLMSRFPSLKYQTGSATNYFQHQLWCPAPWEALLDPPHHLQRRTCPPHRKRDPPFLSSSCSNPSLTKGMPYPSSSPPAKPTATGQTQPAIHPFLSDRPA